MEDESSASDAISGEVIEDDVTERDSEQEEMFCRVCDPVDEDIEADAEEEAISGRCEIRACQRGGKYSSTIIPICHQDHGVAYA